MGNLMGKCCLNIRVDCLKPLQCMARLARFERATAWFVVTLTSKRNQRLTIVSYGDNSPFRRILSITYAFLWGNFKPFHTTPPGRFSESPKPANLKGLTRFLASQVCAGFPQFIPVVHTRPLLQWDRASTIFHILKLRI